ncbi:MAG: VWA domain-containing protein, partial [Planctomycetes bacterium]|nr:VWA domain-containing protein [Planctomycetota bacterium]
MDFLNAIFLAATATALIPIIIHLVQRRRVQQVVFGSLRFLKKTSHRVVHRRRFEEFLLVLLRALALAVLAFAFARPFFERSAAEGQVGGKTALGEEAVLVLVDDSYSMRAEDRMERAKLEVLKALREADPAAKVGLAAYSSQYDELAPIGAKQSLAEEAVRRLEPTWRGTNLALALRQANQVLTRADRNEASRRIVLIGDFQESSWKSSGDWTLSPGIELALRNVGESPVQNVFVGRVAVPRLVVAGGFVEVISATVRNLTDKPLADA